MLTTKLGAITVKVSAGLVTPVNDAVIRPLPDASPVATPVAPIVATEGVADAQATAFVMS